MEEMEKYRAKIERRYRRRRTGGRYLEGGRRSDDYKSPPLFTWSTTIQFLTLIIGGIWLLFLAGCVSIKKSILGG